MGERITPVYQGDGFSLTVTLRDSCGSLLLDIYDGSEPLAAQVWPGDDLAVAFSPAVAWLDAAAGTLTVSGTGDQTAALAPGDYPGRVRITDGAETYTAYEFVLPILPAPGSAEARPVYCTLDQLRRHGRTVLAEIQAEEDQAGFREQRADAREWFEEILHAHDPDRHRSRRSPLLWTTRGTGNGLGRNRWLAEKLADEALILTSKVIEINACYAMSLIARNKPEESARFEHRANELAKTLVAELDLDGDGLGDYAIDCTVAGR
jgi:hypothetical protein